MTGVPGGVSGALKVLVIEKNRIKDSGLVSP
jgi:hypothetical protein